MIFKTNFFCMSRKPAYRTIKGHKENFSINPKCYVINPAKRELGKIANIIVENLNKTVREKLHCNQWRNTSNVIDWFQNITDKGNCIFIQFDIEEFYTLITKHLLLKAIEHTKLYTSITQQKLDIILQARKSFFSKNKPWEKTILWIIIWHNIRKLWWCWDLRVCWFVYIIFSWESIWNSKLRSLLGWWFSLFGQD